ncbi:MAG: hypothetical protein DLM69_00345, partial [Candidatus Chloroheliales bacterium]
MEDYRGDQYGEYNRRAWQGYGSGDGEQPPPDLSSIAIVALAAGIASLIGLIIVWLGKLGQPKDEKKLQQIIEAATAGKLDEWAGRGSSKKLARAMHRTATQAGDVAGTVGERAGELGKEAGKRAAELSKEAGKRIGQTVEDVTSSREVKKAARQVSDIRDHLAEMIDNIDLGEYQGKGRKRAATLRKRAEQMLASLEVENRTGKVRKAVEQQAKELGKAIDEANLGDQAGRLAARARDAISSIDVGQALSDAGELVGKKAKEIEHDSRGLRRDAGKLAKKAGKEGGTWLSAITDAVGSFFEDFSKKTLPELTKAAGKAGEQVRGQVVLPTAEYVRKEAIPNVSDAAGNVAEYVRKEAIPNVADAAGNVAEYVRKEAIPNVTDAAGNVAGFVTETA